MIFVTGGCGFIGSNFLHFLKSKTDEEIVVLDNLSYSADVRNINTLKVRLEKVDLSNKESLKSLFKKYNPKNIFHFAAESHVDNSIRDVTPFITSNIIGTINLLQLSNDYEVDLFHHISTDEVYGSLNLEDSSFKEGTPYNPQNPYSASKASSDHFVNAFYNTYKVPVKITNCSNNYGPRQNTEKLIPKVITNALLNNKILLYGNGKNIRDWIYVDDHCEAVYEVFLNGKVGEKYNVGGNCEIENIELIKYILDLLDKSHDLIEYVTDRPGHDLRYSIDNTKIEKEIGWKPKTSIETGLKKTIKWYHEIYSS